MPIPDFTKHGVLPVGCHDCTLDEVKSRFAPNGHRRSLWTDFERFLNWLRTQPPHGELRIDGGFTSDKATPKDIDVVLDLTSLDRPTRDHWIVVYATQRADIEKRFRVDFWVYYPGAQNDLRAWFEYVRPEEALKRGMLAKDRKGTLKVVV